MQEEGKGRGRDTSVPFLLLAHTRSMCVAQNTDANKATRNPQPNRLWLSFNQKIRRFTHQLEFVDMMWCFGVVLSALCCLSLPWGSVGLNYTNPYVEITPCGSCHLTRCCQTE